MERKPKLIALDHDLNSLREVAVAMTPWFEVVKAREPMNVMALIESDPSITTIVTEQVLPKASGVSLLESIRTLRPKIRRVLMTGYGDLATIVGGLHSGAIQAVVNKPFTREELIATILTPDARQTGLKRATA